MSYMSCVCVCWDVLIEPWVETLPSMRNQRMEGTWMSQEDSKKLVNRLYPQNTRFLSRWNSPLILTIDLNGYPSSCCNQATLFPFRRGTYPKLKLFGYCFVVTAAMPARKKRWPARHRIYMMYSQTCGSSKNYHQRSLPSRSVEKFLSYQSSSFWTIMSLKSPPFFKEFPAKCAYEFLGHWVPSLFTRVSMEVSN